MDAEDEETRVLSDAIHDEGEKFVYEYDFGDGWEHEILVEKIIADSDNLDVPKCVGGKRACPPEDCGGPYGYQRVLAVLAKPGEDGEFREWVGEYDLEAFSIDLLNRAFKRASQESTCQN